MTTFLRESLAITDIELRKLLRDPTELLSRAIQPVLWLAIFGRVLSRARGLDAGSGDYLSFMTPGILAQSVLFSAIFYGIAVIWERDLGVVQKLLASPASRTSLIFGKAVAADFRGIVQALVIYVIAWAMGVSLNWNIASIAGVMLLVALGSAVFSTFSLIMACIVKTRERFMGIGQVLTMPLFFASNAIYPLDLMPPWLKFIATVNPLTYLVDGLRGLMVLNGASTHPLYFNIGVLTVIFAVMLMLAARLYPRLAE
ncbi:MAG TPA: ABC transporter permease [Candidatus Acidoferrum sp.]|nr:ABC transporter permease [Candidatus Acidoferrum sp.]